MQKNIRPPAVAGQFYEANDVSLKRHIDQFQENCSQDKAVKGKTVRAAILPHAGYVFSGETAVKTLYNAKDCQYDKVVVIAPSHRLPFHGLALSSYSDYETPLGTMPIDMFTVSELENAGSKYISTLNEAHTSEHALEVELPIIQTFFGDIDIIPMICGHISVDSARELATVLKPYWQPNILWVISSDFTHYGHSFGYTPFSSSVKENLEKLDLGAAEKITQLNLQGFSDYIDDTQATICGANPIRVLLAVIESMKQEESLSAKVIDYTTSGEQTGDYSHCVSYAGIAFYQ